MLPDYVVAREKARQQYDAAFHLLNVTFPLIKDHKLLLGVMYNLFSSLEASMDAILAYERQLRLVPFSYDHDFRSKINLFRSRSAVRNKIPTEFINLMLDLGEILEIHKKGPIEFQRGNKLIICGPDYHVKTISLKELQEYLTLAKQFYNHMDRITAQLAKNG